MKKFFTLIATAFMAISASAQAEAGSITLQPNVGVTYTSATGDATADPAIALTAGVEGMYMVNEKFGVALGLNYTGNNTSTDDIVNSTYYFNLPLTANYYVTEGLALKAGVALNIHSQTKVDGESGIGDFDFGDIYKSTYFAIPVGVSYELSNGLVFDLRYSFGVSDVLDMKGFDNKLFGLGSFLSKEFGDKNTSFNTLSFTVGYKF